MVKTKNFNHVNSLIPFLLCIVLLIPFEAYSIDIPLSRAQEDSIRQLIRDFKFQIAQDARNQQILNQISGLYFQLEEMDSSEFWINLSKKIDEDNPESRFWRGRIFLYKGESAIVPIERIKELFKQDNHSKAIREFEKAVEKKEDFWEARYFLGKAYVAKGGDTNYHKAIATYDSLLALQPDYKDTYYELAIAHIKLKKYPQAVSYLNYHAGRHRVDARPYIKMSNIENELGKTESASRLFMQGIVRLRDKEMLHSLFLEIKDIASKAEKEEYESLSFNKRGLFFQKFWKRRDPTPFTDENERYTEHFRRVSHARHVFSFTAPPFYDDRGRIYVKYGEPDVRYTSTMSSVDIKDNESWSYETSIRRGLVFDFVQFGAHYQLVQDLTAASKAGVPYSFKTLMATELYSERAPDLGGVYNMFSVSTRNTDLMDFTNEKSNAIDKAPTEVFKYDYNASPLSFTMRQAQFRGENGKTKLEIYHTVMGTNLGSKKEGENKYFATVNSNIGIFDEYYSKVDQQKNEVKLQGTTAEQIKDVASVDESIFSLNPDQTYEVVFELENPEGNMLGIGNMPITIKNFQSDSLLLSDIEFAARVEPALKKGRFSKDSLYVLPYTFPKFDRDTPVTIYYEIYNLSKNPAGETDYVIDYKVTTLERKEGGVKKFFRSIGSIFGGGKKPSVSSTYERQGHSEVEKQYLTLDIGKLPPGKIELSVTVTDRTSNQTGKSSTSIDVI